MPTAAALIPARSGSTRVEGKNVRELAGHPLLAYSIAAARESELFGTIAVSTDSAEIAEIAKRYGAEVPGLRPPELAGPTSPDIEWVQHSLGELHDGGEQFELFSILRPTSPFRRGATIRRAFDQLIAEPEADSIRAVERCRQHPGKMWVLEDGLMRPLLDQPPGTPMHSRQYQDLPEVFVQNSSLEIAWTRVALEGGTIAGERVLPFLTDEAEGFSIDYPEDWDRALAMVSSRPDLLPPIDT